MKRRKQELLLQNQVLKAKDYFIKSLLLIELYHSEAGWKSVEEVETEYNKLSSETTKLKAVKGQIRIRVDGFGLKKYHHPWSKKGKHYTLVQLRDHLMNKIIPHELEPTTMILKDSKFDLPTNKVKFKLGTVAPDINELHITDKETEIEIQKKSMEEIKSLEIDVQFQTKSSSTMQ